MYLAYKNLTSYVEFHESTVEFGLYDGKKNKSEMLTEIEFQHQYKTNGFVIVRLKNATQGPYYLIFSASTIARLMNEELIIKITHDYEGGALFVVENDMPLSEKFTQ